MRPGRGGGGAVQFGMRRPGRAVVGLIIMLVACYVLELILLRIGGAAESLIMNLILVPAEVLEEGKVWQVVTYTVLHSPQQPTHLLNNLLFLFMFAGQLEGFWKTRRLLIAYAVCALSGGLLTLLVALLSRTPALDWLVPHFWASQHLGASGAVVGLTVAWGLTFDQQEMSFLFFGSMKARTFMWIMIGIELLIALSFDSTSSTSHLGGMIGAWVLCRGMWRPSNWSKMFDQMSLERRRKKIESELRIIEGGKGKPRGGNDLPN